MQAWSGGGVLIKLLLITLFCTSAFADLDNRLRVYLRTGYILQDIAGNRPQKGGDFLSLLVGGHVHYTLGSQTLIESYTERPSAQDTFNTPIFGAILGTGLEKVSVELLNSESGFKRVIGRIINPFSFLKAHEDFNAGVIPLRGGAGLVGGWSFD